MRIVYVTAEFPCGHGESFLAHEALELLKRGHHLMIVPRSPRGNVVQVPALAESTQSEPLFSWNVLRGALFEGFLHPVKAAMTFSRVCRGRSPQMLLKNLLVFPKGLWLARLIRRWEADHIHAHWAGTTATLAMVAARMSSTPWSFTAHRWDILENNALAAKAREASFVRFVSESGKALAASLKINDIERATKVIHMGVPVSQAFQTASASPVRPVIICPANLVPVKGHGYLLEALNILKHRAIVPEVWLAGDGELRPALEMRARQLNIADQVRFLGQVEHERLLDFYRNQRVQIIVLPSLELGKGVHEGIPVALIEAMSYGIPAISTQTGGIPELLQGGAGIMVPPADSVALANAIERLLMEPAERLRFGQAGMLRIRQSFSITTVIDQLTDLFLAGPTVKRS